MSFNIDFHGAVKRIMILMMLADGVIEPEEVRAIQITFKRLAKIELSAEEVEQEVQLAKKDGRGITEFLSVLALVLSKEGKAMIIKAAYLIAASDGALHDDEKVLILNIARCLQMDKSEMQRAINSLEQPS